MPLLTAQQCREHCNVIGTDQDDVLLAFLASAEDAAAAYLNRTVHADAGALGAAMDGYPAAVADAHVAYDSATEAADLEQANGDAIKAQAMRDVAALKRATALRAAERAANGIVVNASILAAVKLTLGHLFENREAVVTGPIATALPQGVPELLRPYRLTQMP